MLDLDGLFKATALKIRTAERVNKLAKNRARAGNRTLRWASCETVPCCTCIYERQLYSMHSGPSQRHEQRKRKQKKAGLLLQYGVLMMPHYTASSVSHRMTLEEQST